MKSDGEWQNPAADDDLLSSIERMEEQGYSTRVEIALADTFIKNLETVIESGGRRFLVYGAGVAGEIVAGVFGDKPYPLEFVGFLDRNASIEVFYGRPVFNPNDLHIYKGIDAVILCAYESEPEMETKLSLEIFPKLDFVPPAVLKTASSKLYQEYCQKFKAQHFLNNGISNRRGDLDDAVVFIAHGPYYNLLRHSVALREVGLRTILVTRDMKLVDEQGDYFDKVLFFSSLSELEALNSADILGIHVQNWATKNYFPVSIQKIIKKPAVCEFQDLSCLTLLPEQLYRFAGLTQERFERDIVFEKLVFKLYDAVLLPYTRAVLPELAARGYSIYPDRFFHYPPPPCGRFFSDADPMTSDELPRLLFVGGVPPDFSDDRLYHDAKMHTIIASLLREGFKVKMLNNPKAAGTKALIRKNYPFYYDLSLTQKRFEFEIGAPPYALASKSAGWHFGLMLYDLCKVLVDKAHFDCMVPSKFFTYMELGLPVIVSRSLRAVADLVEKNGVGIVVEDGAANNLSRTMQGWQQTYPMLAYNVKKFRNACEGKRKVKTLLSAYRKAGMKLPTHVAGIEEQSVAEA